MAELCAAAFAERSLETALDLARSAFSVARDEQRIVLVSSLIEADAVVLGARQRSARVAVAAQQAIARRATSGTTAMLRGRVLHHALAFPNVDSLMASATWATLLNRNLRGFLRGYSKLGVQAQYLGRETLHLARKPFAVCGYDVAPGGATLIEVFVGVDRPVSKPSESAQPCGLLEAVNRAHDPASIVSLVHQSIAEHYELTLTQISLEPISGKPLAEPEGVAFCEHAVPIGIVEAAVNGDEVLIRGDVLCAQWALDAIEKRASESMNSGALEPDILEPLQHAPLHGAKPMDILEVLRLAASALE